jgi:hypothetical protein
MLCLGMLFGVIGCKHNDAEIRDAHYNKMRLCFSAVAQLIYDGKARSVDEAIVLLRKNDPSAFEVEQYGFKEKYILNPNAAYYTNTHFTNASASNVVAIVAVVPLEHDSKPYFLGVNFAMQSVDLEKLPEWSKSQ